MYYLKRFFQIFLSLKKDKYTLKQRWVIAVFQVKFEMFLIKILIVRKIDKFTANEIVDLLNKYYPFDNIKYI